MPLSSMISTFLYLSATALGQLFTSATPQNHTPSQREGASYTTTPERLQRRLLLFLPSSQGKRHLNAPPLYAMLLFFLAILFGCLIPDGLHVNTHPLWALPRLHVHRGIHQKRASGTI